MGATNIAALIAEELAALAADAHALGERLSAGDVVTALVLPSNGLTDLLDVGGLRVAAELPPTLVPGQTITVLVTGFADDRINLQIVPAQDPPEESGSPSATVAPPMLPAPAKVVRGAQPAETGSLPERVPLPGRGGASSPGASALSEHPLPAAAQYSGATVTASPVSSTAARGSSPQTIEARLASSHLTLPAAPRPPGAGSPQRPAAPGIPPRPPVITRSSAILPQTAAGGVSAAAAAARSTAASPPAPPPGALPTPRGPAAFSEPAALLRGLRIPVTAANLAAARLALEFPEKVPAALSALERALSDSSDPRLATLKTLTSFLARLDPRSPVFAAQIAAFVDHVVTGREARLVQLSPMALPEDEGADAAEEPVGTDVPAGPVGAPNAERNAALRAALDYDFKSQLLAAAAEGGNDATPQGAALERALSGALAAITALQLSAASTLAARPDGLNLCIPVALPDGFVQARVRIGRDAPGGAAIPLDGDNFHIAFVLETHRLGTVAIELKTVGRAVALSVKTEAALTQRIFSRALGLLSERLEKLRYHVTSAEAVVAPAAAAPSAAAPVPAPEARSPAGDPNRLVDADA